MIDAKVLAWPEAKNELQLVPIDGLLAVLPEAVPLLIPAVNRSGGRTDIYHVIASLMVGGKQLWISRRNGIMDCAMVGYFTNFPLLRAYDLEFIGGRVRRNWLQFETEISAWAKSHGATEFIGHVRPGWLRVLTGWTVLWTETRKPL